MAEQNWFDLQRDSLQLLQTLVRERADGEKALTEAHAAAIDAAERDIAKSRRILGGAKARALGEFASERLAAEAQLQGENTDAETAARTGYTETKTRTEQKHRAAEAAIKNETKDRIWTVDSLHEAGEKEAGELRDAQLRTAKLAGEQIEKQWIAAELILARVKLAREDVQFASAGLPSATKTDPEGKLEKCLEDSAGALVKLQRASLYKFAGILGTALGTLLAGAVTFGIALAGGVEPATAGGAGAIAAIVLGACLRQLFFYLARRQLRDRGKALGVFLSEAERAREALVKHAEGTYKSSKGALKRAHASDRAAIDEEHHSKLASAVKKAASTLQLNQQNYETAHSVLLARRRSSESLAASRHDARAAELEADYDGQLRRAEDKYESAIRTAEERRDAAWQKLADRWQSGLNSVNATARESAALAAPQFPAWPAILSGESATATLVPGGIRFGEYTLDETALPFGEPTDTRLTPEEHVDATVPAFLPFPDRCSVVLKARDEGRAATANALQSIMLRFLTGLPPGKVRFTIFDPVGLGENFAAFMHLADFDELLVTNRIWTEPGQIEARLTDLTEHMENVIQKYLRNQYASIEEYNRAAGEVAEPYRVLIVANFPTNFTPDAARRLVSIMGSGPACGVCTVVGVDTAVALPRDFRLADLEQVSLNLAWDKGRFHPTDKALSPFPLALDPPPASGDVVTIVRKIGEASRNAARVEVPFEFIAPAPEKVWTASTQKGFDIPIGRSGATKRQILALGKGTAQHALIAGKTGSGKSTLMHALITNLAMTYRPEEAELYLIDFKKGVEFKMYAEMHLPHARVIAIESEREFGLSVLQRLDGILRERGDRFRALGVNDFPSFRESHPGELLPRILLVVDEFQEFFVEDDKLAQESGLLIDRLVRQGRAFGVHVVLGSQTLGGGYSLPRSTIDQMAVRIALQCSEADAQLILSKDNSAARLLTRPGEAIYNDANGLMEGNNPFQVVWLSEDRRETILHNLAGRPTAPHECLVFEGNAAAELSENRMLRKLLAAPGDAGPATIWLGDAIAIKEPTAAVFRPQSGANLLLIGQSEEAALAIAVSGLVSLTARFRDRRTATVLDGTPDDSEFADTLRCVCSALRIGPIVERTDLGATIARFAAEVDGRLNGGIADRSPRFLFVHGLHRLRELRKAEEDFGYGRRGDKTVSPGDQFAVILREGPAVGVHVVAWCDSVMNLTRAVERQGMREFTLRVLFQMSANDSAQLVDTPAASKLGRTRALFVEEGTERPEKFRPYGLPDTEWLRGIGADLGFTEPRDSTEPGRPDLPMQADDSPLALATE